MSTKTRPVVVLKLGGSVLTEPDACHVAVHEIYRHVRTGHGVVAVCSAFKGETDRLASLSSRLSGRADNPFAAALLATGELQSASCLAIACDNAGLPVRLLDPTQVGLVTRGPAIDADPIDIDVHPILNALNSGCVVIVPGFSGRDESGAVTLLGRGGSDLTALFLADRLGARCRLVKDVAGWFDTDVVFRSLHLHDAVRRPVRLVQPKAIAFAARNSVSFNVGRLSDVEDTLVGTVSSRTTAPGDNPVPLRVAILGVGTVGAGVWRRLQQHAADFSVVGGVVKNLETTRPDWVDPELLSQSCRLLPEYDVIVDALPDAESAYEFVSSALHRGKSVVSANKDLIARRGPELVATASACGADLIYSSAIGGACPILETAEHKVDADSVVEVRAVLNATSNAVLDGMRGGLSFERAVADAQTNGYAEADPSTDLCGRDAANKLVLLCHRLTGIWLDPDSISTEEISNVQEVSDCIRQVACLRIDRDGGDSITSGHVDARVELQVLESDDPLFDVSEDWNCAVFRAGDGTTCTVRGRGAGRWPTTESVIADLFDIRRSLSQHTHLQEAS